MNIGVEDGDRRVGHVCSPKIREKYFSGNYHVKFGHFVNFSYIYLKTFQQKCLPQS